MKIHWQLFPLVLWPLWAQAYPASDKFDCDAEAAGIFQAARENKIDMLERYRKNNCNLTQADQRGFTAYDHAALAGNSKLAEWLVQHNYANAGQHSPALIKLVQTGLRFINLDAGVIDGEMNSATKDGIEMFQKAHKLKVDGKMSPEWLGVFYKAVAKKMQGVLGQLGYSAGSADGIIGQNTRSAMQAFRQERSMPQADYITIDDQLLYQLMMAENEANKKAIAKRDAERQARKIAQEAAQRQELARKQEQAKRRAAEQRARAEEAAQTARAQREAEERQLAEQRQREQQALQAAQQQAAQQAARQQAQREAEAARIAEAMAAAEQRAQAEKDAQAKRELEAQMQALEAQRRAQEQAAAEAERQRQAALRAEEARLLAEKQRQEQEAAAKRAAEEKARREAEAARQLELAAAKRAEEAANAARLARREANTAFRAAERGMPVLASSDIQVAGQSGAAVAGGTPVNKTFNKISGMMNYQSATVCTIGGQPIEASWCQSYYPQSGGRQCDAIVSRTGVVVSILCR